MASSSPSVRAAPPMRQGARRCVRTRGCRSVHRQDKTIVALAVLRRVSQGALAWRHRPGRHATPGTWVDLGAVALGLALVGLLFAFGLWPLMLRRL
jgi:hypothetical protein